MRAEVVRRGWFLEELSRAPIATAYQSPRSQISLSAITLNDSVTTSLSGLAAVPYLELGFHGGQIYSGLLDTAEGVVNRGALQREMTFFGVEVARYFVDSRNYYGRLSVKFVEFFPSKLLAWRPALHAGTNPSPLSPWNVEFSLAGFLYFNHLSDFMFATMSTGRTHYFGKDQNVRISGEVAFGQKSKLLVGESLLFTVGMSAAYSSGSLGQITLSVPFRIWIDRAVSSSYISDFDPPAANIKWTLFL